MANISDEQRWRVVSLGSTVLAAVLVRSVMKMVWSAARDGDPPLNPLREDSTWTDAVLFSVLTGLSVGLARLGARAIAASTWQKTERSHLSPGGEG